MCVLLVFQHRELEASIAFSAGVTQYRLGQEDASLASHLLSLSLRRALFPLPHPDLCASLEAVAALLDAKGDAEQALATRLEAHKCRFVTRACVSMCVTTAEYSMLSVICDFE